MRFDVEDDPWQRCFVLVAKVSVKLAQLTLSEENLTWKTFFNDSLQQASAFDDGFDLLLEDPDIFHTFEAWLWDINLQDIFHFYFLVSKFGITEFFSEKSKLEAIEYIASTFLGIGNSGNTGKLVSFFEEAGAVGYKVITKLDADVKRKQTSPEIFGLAIDIVQEFLKTQYSLFFEQVQNYEH